jgi:hypothetical protein
MLTKTLIQVHSGDIFFQYESVTCRPNIVLYKVYYILVYGVIVSTTLLEVQAGTELWHCLAPCIILPWKLESINRQKVKALNACLNLHYRR